VGTRKRIPGGERGGAKGGEKTEGGDALDQHPVYFPTEKKKKKGEAPGGGEGKTNGTSKMGRRPIGKKAVEKGRKTGTQRSKNCSKRKEKRFPWKTSNEKRRGQLGLGEKGKR